MWKILNECVRYEINECGEIRNRETGEYRTPTINNRGYKVLSFTLDDGKRKMYQLHRLVACNFLPEPSQEIIDGYANLKTKIIQVDHINRNCLDNHVSNLRWCTPKQNIANSAHDKSGLNSRFAKLTQEQLDEMIVAHHSGDFDTKMFVEKFGIHRDTLLTHMRAAGISRKGFNGKSGMSKDDIEFIIKNYTKKGEYTVKVLAEKYNVTTNVIYKTLRKYNK